MGGLQATDHMDAQWSPQMPLTGSDGGHPNPVHELLRNLLVPTQEYPSLLAHPTTLPCCVALQTDPSEMVKTHSAEFIQNPSGYTVRGKKKLDEHKISTASSHV